MERSSDRGFIDQYNRSGRHIRRYALDTRDHRNGISSMIQYAGRYYGITTKPKSRQRNVALQKKRKLNASTESRRVRGILPSSISNRRSTHGGVEEKNAYAEMGLSRLCCLG